MEEVVILSGKRTPMGSYGGGLRTCTAIELGTRAVQAALEASAVSKERVESLVMGNVIAGNLGQHPARQVGLQAGLPESTCATNVNKICASGMKAIQILANDIRVGQVELGIAGGMESMSNAPYYVGQARFGLGFGSKSLVDGLEKDGLVDAYSGDSMGVCADLTASTFSWSREAQDDYAQSSFERARVANFDHEVLTVEVQQGRQVVQLSRDEQIAKGDFEKMRTLRPAFTKTGTVTAANASSMSDGASALVLASRKFAEANALKSLAIIRGYAEAEHEPQFFTTAPISATQHLIAKVGISLEEIDLFEVNEAFAVVALQYMRQLGIPREKLNHKGGAVALGHALGSSGARIVVTLLHSLKEQNKRYGLAAICNGGGGASAILIENMDYVK